VLFSRTNRLFKHINSIAMVDPLSSVHGKVSDLFQCCFRSASKSSTSSSPRQGGRGCLACRLFPIFLGVIEERHHPHLGHRLSLRQARRDQEQFEASMNLRVFASSPRSRRVTTLPKPFICASRWRGPDANPGQGTRPFPILGCASSMRADCQACLVVMFHSKTEGL